MSVFCFLFEFFGVMSLIEKAGGREGWRKGVGMW